MAGEETKARPFFAVEEIKDSWQGRGAPRSCWIRPSGTRSSASLPWPVVGIHLICGLVRPHACRRSNTTPSSSIAGQAGKPNLLWPSARAWSFYILAARRAAATPACAFQSDGVVAVLRTATRTVCKLGPRAAADHTGSQLLARDSVGPSDCAKLLWLRAMLAQVKRNCGKGGRRTDAVAPDRDGHARILHCEKTNARRQTYHREMRTSSFSVFT